MTHIVCGTTLLILSVPEPDGPLVERIPHCPLCGCAVPVEEIG